VTSTALLTLYESKPDFNHREQFYIEEKPSEDFEIERNHYDFLNHFMKPVLEYKIKYIQFSGDPYLGNTRLDQLNNLLKISDNHLDTHLMSLTLDPKTHKHHLFIFNNVGDLNKFKQHGLNRLLPKPYSMYNVVYISDIESEIEKELSIELSKKPLLLQKENNSFVKWAMISQAVFLCLAFVFGSNGMLDFPMFIKELFLLYSPIVALTILTVANLVYIHKLTRINP